MQDWDPDLYRQFEAERTRPARDLLTHIHAASPSHISDLGCGRVTRLNCCTSVSPTPN